MCTGMKFLQPAPSIQGNQFCNQRDVVETEFGEVSDSYGSMYEDECLL